MKKLYLQSALQSFLYRAIILYNNNNVPKIIIYNIYIYIYQIIAGGGKDLLLPVRKLYTKPN